MRIATMMSIAVLGLSGAAIAQVTTMPDQETPPTMQDETGNNAATPDETMGNDMLDNEADEMDRLPPTIPDTVPPATPDTDSAMPPMTAPTDDTGTTTT